MDETKDDEQKPTKLEAWLDMHAKDAPLCEGIKAAVEKYGEEDVAVLDTRGGVAVFRAPHAGEYKRFTSNILNDKADVKASAAEILARACVVYPQKPVFGAWCEKWGGIPSAVLKPLTKLAGAELVERGNE